ncbi:MAG: Lpg1974 family pore-forming outer membrane protein [Rhabdochlamydiaceae bacterium]
MAAKFFFSLTAFSLALHGFLSADGSAFEEDLFEEVILEDGIATADGKKEDQTSQSSESNRQTAKQKAPSTENTEKQPPKKLKPQYAGARRAPEKIKVNDGEKKPGSRVKNKWFSSKTQPKVEKKEVAAVEESSTELPADRPHYTRMGNSDYLVEQEWSNDEQQVHSEKETDRYDYLRGGFLAPRGHIYVTAEWLYWRTREEGMEFVTAKRIKFDFQSGFRVGLGVHLPYDYWDIYVNYTRFNPRGSKSAHGSFYPLFLFQGAGAPQGPSVDEGHARWKIEFQSADVEIGRSFYVAKTLAFRPFFGLKGAWIDQDAHIRYAGGFIPVGQTFHTYFKNDFKGAGPLIGIESNWLIGSGFSFFGDFAAALIAGHFHNKQKQHQLGGAEVVDLNNDFNLVGPTVQLVAGLAWDCNFNRDQCHFGLSAGFESQYWWGQNQTEQFTDKDFPIYVREKGDLAFYGLTLRGRFDF